MLPANLQLDELMNFDLFAFVIISAVWRKTQTSFPLDCLLIIQIIGNRHTSYVNVVGIWEKGSETESEIIGRKGKKVLSCILNSAESQLKYLPK